MAQINSNNITITPKQRVDSTLFVEVGNVISKPFGGGTTDIIVKRLYDRNDSLIATRIVNEPPKIVLGEVQIDLEADMVEFGYSSGAFKLVYNFWRVLVGDTTGNAGAFIREISPSKTEIRLVPASGYETAFDNFAKTRLSDSELNNMLDVIFNPLPESLPYNGFDPESIIANLDPQFADNIFRFDRGGISSSMERDAYLLSILTSKVQRSISNTRQSVFERIRLNGLVDQDELKVILSEEFKINIRNEFV
jgi:hypothetical protein